MQPHPAYSFFMALALVVFLAARHFLPKPAGLTALSLWQRACLTLAGFVGGAFGAKLPFVSLDPASWFRLSAWFSDGKTIVVGLLGAYFAVELMKLFLGIRVKTGDAFAVPLALALAIGRWGCFCNGCCYGTATALPWGVAFNVEGQVMKCHPTQIYESVFHLTMAGVLLLLLRADLLRCQRLKLYLIAYGVYRFLTEFIRPEPVWWLGLTFYQWAALVLVGLLTIQWVVDQRSVRSRDEEQKSAVVVCG